MARTRKLAADILRVDERFYSRRDAKGRLITSQGLTGARLFDAGDPLAMEEAERVRKAGRTATVLTLTGIALDEAVKARKKHKTYAIKIGCSKSYCGWTARAVESHIVKGMPVCVCGERWERLLTEEEEASE